MARRACPAPFHELARITVFPLLLVLALPPGAFSYVIVIGEGESPEKKPSLKPLPALPEQRTGNPAGYRVAPAKPPPYGHVIPASPILPLTGEAPAKSRDTVFFGSQSSQDSRGNLRSDGSNQTSVGSVGTPWIGGGDHNRDQGGKPTTGPGSTNNSQGGRPTSPTSTPGSVNYSSQPSNRPVFRTSGSPGSSAPPARPRKWFTPRSYSTGVSRFASASYGTSAGAPPGGSVRSFSSGHFGGPVHSLSTPPNSSGTSPGIGRGRSFVGGRKY